MGARCWSKGCTFKAIAEAILQEAGQSLYPNPGSTQRPQHSDYITGQVRAPGRAKPRLAYRRDYPGDFQPGPCDFRANKGRSKPCGRVDIHKHPWNRGKVKGNAAPGLGPRRRQKPPDAWRGREGGARGTGGRTRGGLPVRRRPQCTPSRLLTVQRPRRSCVAGPGRRFQAQAQSSRPPP